MTGCWIHFWYTCKKYCRNKWSFHLGHAPTFIVKRFGPVKYKTLCLKKAAVWMGLLADQKSLKIIFKIFFVDFMRVFSCSKSMLFSKAPTSGYKKMWNNYCCILSHFRRPCVSSKSVSQIFQILFHRLETKGQTFVVGVDLGVPQSCSYLKRTLLLLIEMYKISVGFTNIPTYLNPFTPTHKDALNSYTYP